MMAFVTGVMAGLCVGFLVSYWLILYFTGWEVDLAAVWKRHLKHLWRKVRR